MLKIRQGIPEDLPAILGIFDSARQYMRQTGNLTQWINGYPGEKEVLSDIDRNSLYVGENGDGKVVMTFALVLGEDPTYREIDGNWLNDLPYGTIHRIASDGSCPKVLREAVKFALSLTENIRVDTHKDNKPMLKALSDLGFLRCGVIICADGTPREAFQYPD